MGRFQELNKNVMYLSELFLSNQNLCKLLYYNESSPLSQPDIEDTSLLLFNKLLPQPKSVDAINEKNTILTYVFSNAKLNRNNLKFKDSKLIIQIICHLSLWKIDEGNRVYLIAEEIDKILNELRNTKLSIGNVLFDSWVYREYSDQYCGYYLTYDLCDFN